MTPTKKKRKKKRPKYSDEMGLKRGTVRKTVRDFVDFDYVSKLSPEERDWLSRFSAEFYQSRFKNDGSDLMPKGSDARSEQYGANNARNRDIWHKQFPVGLETLEPEPDKEEANEPQVVKDDK